MMIFISGLALGFICWCIGFNNGLTEGREEVSAENTKKEVKSIIDDRAEGLKLLNRIFSISLIIASISETAWVNCLGKSAEERGVIWDEAGRKIKRYEYEKKQLTDKAIEAGYLQPREEI